MVTPEALSCKELVELVTGYFDGALSPAETEHFEQHMAACGACRNYLAQMRQTIRLVGTLAEDAIPSEIFATFLRTFRDWKQA
ncbi:MAG: anti-sigma factor family protein [Ktedonobacterales bacterium]